MSEHPMQPCFHSGQQDLVFASRYIVFFVFIIVYLRSCGVSYDQVCQLLC